MIFFSFIRPWNNKKMMFLLFSRDGLTVVLSLVKTIAFMMNNESSFRGKRIFEKIENRSN